MKMRPKVSIDTIGIDPLINHRLCPSMAALIPNGSNWGGRGGGGWDGLLSI